LGRLGHRSSLPLELGKVDQLEVGRERPDQPGGVLQGNPPEFSNERDLLAGVVALAELLGPQPDRLLQLIERDALMLAQSLAMLRAIGFTREDLSKPLIGVGHSWIETMPCNFNHRRLAEKVKAGIRAAGGTPMEFNTIAVSDGVSMGTEGMKASLVSREVIADSIELVARGHLLDGLVLITGCDKTIPAAVMALVRINIPGLALYSGTIAAGRHRGRDITLMEVFEAVGAVSAGTMSWAELREIEDSACPGAGACGGQFT